MLPKPDFDRLSGKFQQISLWIYHHLPGIGLSITLALLATLLQNWLGLKYLSPLILAIGLGIISNNLWKISSFYQLGIDFCLKKILRVAIALLGLQFSFTQVLAVGGSGLIIIVATILSTFGFTLWLGKGLGVNYRLTQLIAAGTSICGASAVVAANTAVEGKDEDVSYAVAIVTVFGTGSMVIYPLLSTLFDFQAFGIWCGASIHEVAQVVAASFQVSPVSGEIAVITKLSRVLFLIPMVFLLGTKPKGKSQPPIPWFMFYFIFLIGVNSIHLLPNQFRDLVVQGNRLLLTVSLAAMGLVTSLAKLKQVGIKPLLLAGGSWLFISVVSFCLIKGFYG
ncbi:MAG: YeiH family protein [Pseudanabaenaceae cyanobacterium bins.68]|nr:YeiH family protein [Pseudanabaenaceae cyanobacterium bins.68]